MARILSGVDRGPPARSGPRDPETSPALVSVVVFVDSVGSVVFVVVVGPVMGSDSDVVGSVVVGSVVVGSDSDVVGSVVVGSDSAGFGFT